jgi:AraC-like DNA-binding protein
VQQQLIKLKISHREITFGMVHLIEPTPSQLDQLKQNLLTVGFEILDDSKQKLIENIKKIVIQQVHHNSGDKKQNFSKLITDKICKDYSYLSSLFSEVEGITIEKYIINQKIEKVKELIIYDELNLSEIAFQLNYSSVAHLSAQFKQATGLTPTIFKKSGTRNRKAIDKL